MASSHLSPEYYALNSYTLADRLSGALIQNTPFCDIDYATGNSSLANDTCLWANNSESYNLSMQPQSKLKASLTEAIVTGFIMALMIIGTIFGNLLVIMAVLTYRPLKTVQNYLIVSLSFADCAVAFVVMPLSTIDILFEPWLLGTAMCDLWTTMDIFCCTASILNLCAIAIDRYFAIHDPIRYACKRTALRMAVYIALVYALSACISIPPLLGWKPMRTEWECMLSSEKAYVVVSACVSFYLPCLAMCFIYVKIYLAARRRLRKRAAMREMPTITASNATSIPRDSRRSALSRTVSNKTASSRKTESYKLNDLSDSRCGNGKKLNSNNEVDENSLMLDSNEDTEQGEAHNSRQNLESTTHDVVVCFDVKNNSDCYNSSSMFENNCRVLDNERQKKISLTKERRAARTLGILMACFLLCWMPFFIHYIITPWCQACQELDRKVIDFVTWLGYANSLLNPPLYVGFNIEYRRAFRRILHI